MKYTKPYFSSALHPAGVTKSSTSLNWLG